jgi:hypothetical protein
MREWGHADRPNDQNATDTRTVYILQGLPSEHYKCPSEHYKCPSGMRSTSSSRKASWRPLDRQIIGDSVGRRDPFTTSPNLDGSVLAPSILVSCVGSCQLSAHIPYRLMPARVSWPIWYLSIFIFLSYRIVVEESLSQELRFISQSVD